MNKWSLKTISAIIICFIGILNIAVLSFFGYNILKKNIEIRYYDKSQLLLIQSRKIINERLENAEKIINYLASLDSIRLHDSEPFRKMGILNDYIKFIKDIRSLSFAGADGKLISSTGIDNFAGYRAQESLWYKDAVKRGRGAVWSGPLLDYKDQKIVFSVSSATYKNKKLTGVVSANFNVSDLNELLGLNKPGDKGYMMLLNSSGRVISNHESYFIGEDVFNGRLSEITEPEKIYSFRCSISESMFVINALKLKNGVYIAACVSMDEVHKAVVEEFWIFFVFELVFLLIITSVTYLLARRGIEPVRSLSLLMSEAEAGNYSVRAGFHNYEEVSLLSGHFNSMLEGIQSRDAILKHREHKINNLAYYDSLTGLPNRLSLLESIDKALRDVEIESRDGRAPSCGALLFIDLDGFKNINDTMGHSIGDSVLREVALRLRQNLRYNQIAARIGGDEFVVLLGIIETTDVAGKVSQRILDLLNRPIIIEETVYQVGASIGIVLYPLHGRKAGVLLKKADIAMYKAKRNGKNNYQIFEENLEEEIIRRNLVETEIRRSIHEKLFSVNYQAKYSFRDGRICGFEALLRNNNDKLADCSLNEIIRVAEETGMIVNIEKLVFRESFRFLKKLNDEYCRDLRVSVNASSRHINQDSFTGTVLDEIYRSGVNSSKIDIEITETMMMDHTKNGTAKLLELREIGLGIQMDDFGTGYSSLSYLQNLPINCVKIDKSFIESMELDVRKRNIIALIIEIAHNLNLTVVAEGIENDKQYYYLKTYKCDYAQGFYLHRPAPAEDIIKMLKKVDLLYN